MSESLEAFQDRLCGRFGAKLLSAKLAVNQITAQVPPQHLVEICTALRDEPDFRFEQLVDLCGMDYSAYGQADWETEDTTSTGFSRGVASGAVRESRAMPARYAAVYQLLSVTRNRRLRLRCYAADDPPRLPSVVDVWASANWYEREAFDLFGILFEGHPDLRRLLTDYGFIGHPFRKDFPLEGNVEVRYDPDQKRVVYQPVTIKNRVLVPRVIRHDNRYEQSG
ncbi:MAG: NADH-quinone oxidoreductase subunit C [Gammaproteobacteria bacterium]|nr:NADH-quinone oxidoreductase subunit C [Gammaproteobacteria bacterium]